MQGCKNTISSPSLLRTSGSRGFSALSSMSLSQIVEINGAAKLSTSADRIPVEFSRTNPRSRPRTSASPDARFWVLDRDQQSFASSDQMAHAAATIVLSRTTRAAIRPIASVSGRGSGSLIRTGSPSRNRSRHERLSGFDVANFRGSSPGSKPGHVSCSAPHSNRSA